LRVLVVDDDEAIRDVVTQTLIYAGCDVVCAADGTDAIRVLCESRRDPFDLILLDWRMPTPAPQFVSAYRRLPPPHAPIIVLTAGSDPVEYVEEIGAAGFLRKPFDLDELTALVNRFAARPSPRPAQRRVTRTQRAAGGAAAMRAKEAAGEARKRLLLRLRDEVAKLRAAHATVLEDQRRLLAAEAARPLTAEETRQLRGLRQESERLRWELQQFWHEFEQVRQGKLGG
jgi:DNA-binding response OmpR family regulator